MMRAMVAEGRTVLLSSHLLDEVEKVCDQVAIGCRLRALALLSAHPAVAVAAGTAESARITLNHTERAEAMRATAGLNHRLVKAGVAVYGIELGPASTVGAVLVQYLTHEYR